MLSKGMRSETRGSDHRPQDISSPSCDPLTSKQPLPERCLLPLPASTETKYQRTISLFITNTSLQANNWKSKKIHYNK